MLFNVSRSAGTLRRFALGLVVLSGAGALGWLWWNALYRTGIAFLPRRAPAEWIVYPSEPDLLPHPRVAMHTEFRRAFHLEQPPAQAVLSLAGFGRYAVAVNGAAPPAPVRSGSNWKQPDRIEVAKLLHAGQNQITIDVTNTSGPPALWLSLDAGGLKLKSDESWEASYAGAEWRAARLASRPKVASAGSPLSGAEEPGASFRERWPTLVLFAALSAVGWGLLNWRARSGSASRSSHSVAREWLPVLMLAGLWAALFANNLRVLAPLHGFDLQEHLAYICYLQEHHALPLAGQGTEMVHPPLYYLLGASILSLLSLSVSQDGGVMALRVMGLVIGISHFVLVWASLRLLFAGDRSRQSYGLVLAAFLPPLLYLSQYVTNEGLAAALVSASVCLALRMLKQECVSWRACAGLGLCLGAALLTKSTAVLAVPPVLGALILKSMARRAVPCAPLTRENTDALRPGRGAQGTAHPALGLQVALVLGVCVIVCGWHYARLWVHYGSPLIGNWDPRLGSAWCQDDGYRTSAFYAGFGEALFHPWFSGFKSFGDGMYSTLWGDGQFGGATDFLGRPAWNYRLMSVCYWLALLPTLAVLLGAVLALAGLIRRPSPEWFIVLGLAFTVTFAVLHVSLVVPYISIAKAFYGLSALVPLCAFGAWGLDVLGRWSGKLRPGVCILFAVWAITSYASLWVSPSSAATTLARARSLREEGRQDEAVGLLKATLEREPESTGVRSFLAYLLMETGDLGEASRNAEAAVREQPSDWAGHLVLAGILDQQRQLDRAAEHAQRAVQLAPAHGPGYEQLATLLVRSGHYAEAIRVARQGLGVAAFSPELRLALGTALISSGEAAEGVAQLQLACALKPTWGEPHVVLGAALAKQGALDEAIIHLREAVRLEPGNAEAHCQLAVAFSARHSTADAIAQYTEALRLAPDLAEALNNLAWIRAAHAQAEFRDGAEAVRLAERACTVIEFKEPVLVGTLAAAYAEAGRFEEAVATARQARELALARGQKELAAQNAKLMELFSARRPYREPKD